MHADADEFWTDQMSVAVNIGEYTFSSTPSALQENSTRSTHRALKETSAWALPAGFPWLDVEIGGGMAAAYNHRVHMEPNDMPAMHLCDLGSGVNALGYYMYAVHTAYTCRKV
jgi:hypothetical protein